MDDFTRKHLLQWVERTIPDREQEQAFNSIASFLWFADDQDYWANQGWRRVYDAAMEFETNS